MGIAALSDPATLASSLLALDQRAQAAEAPHRQPELALAARENDGVYPNREQTVEQSFASAVYQRETLSLSLSARFQEVAARFADSREDAETVAVGQQLSFDFFTESTYEQLILFQERTARVAEGLDGTRQTTFTELSQRVAARFEFSLSISATSLQGFADAAEGTAGLDALFGRLLDYTEQLLDQTDAMFNDFFESLAGFDLAGLQEKLREQLEKALADLLGTGNGRQAQLGSGQGASASAVSVQIEFSFSASVSVEASIVQESDPIILDLDGDGFEMTSYRNGAEFDILGNGAKQNTAFVTGGDAFLALDRNGDGVINSGRELFGDQLGAANGYEELRKLDDNGDGVIDKRDRRFGELLLFRDNGNGITEDGELLTLEQAGIESLSLRYANADQQAAGGNRIAQLASYRRADGSLGRAGDAVLNYTV